MLITAHGGAFNTGRNSKLFFDTIKDYNVDVIEVDIWKSGKLLYLSHMPSLMPKRCLPLEYAFDFIAKYDFKINCDVKQRNLVKHVLELAQKKGVTERIIFTGSVCKVDIKNLSHGEVYLNKFFFTCGQIKTNNVKKMKERIDSLKCSNIKGINLKYTYCTEEFLNECQKYDLPVSVFVVDNPKEMERLAKRTELANITTNYPDKILKLIYNK